MFIVYFKRPELPTQHTAPTEQWTLWKEPTLKTTALHLEEPLKLNEWVCSKNRRFTPAGTEDWTLLEGEKKHEEHMLRHSFFSLRCSLTLDFLKLCFFFYQVIVLIIFRHVPLGWFTSRAEQTQPNAGEGVGVAAEYLLSRVTHWFLNTMGCFEMPELMELLLFVFLVTFYSQLRCVCRAGLLLQC